MSPIEPRRQSRISSTCACDAARRRPLIDIRLYARVIWRFKLLVLGGFVLATLLAVLSMTKVSPAVWGAQETLLISQRGFAEGRAVLPQVQTPSGAASGYADPGRLASLSDYYSRLANGDEVRRHIRKEGQAPLAFFAAPVISNVTGNATLLPMLTITGEATTPGRALENTRTASAGFRGYVEQRQVEAGIPDQQRTVISVLNRAAKATVIQPRKKTIPIMVFLAVMAATLGLALILENMRPRLQVVEPTLMSNLADHRASHPQPTASAGRSDARRADARR